MEGWVAGIIRNEDAPLITSNDGQQWQYIATWGPQSMFKDNMGMAVFYRRGDAVPNDNDKESHMILFGGTRRSIDYFMSVVWEQDSEAIRTKEQFTVYLEREREWLSAGGAKAY